MMQVSCIPSSFFLLYISSSLSHLSLPTHLPLPLPLSLLFILIPFSRLFVELSSLPSLSILLSPPPQNHIPRILPDSGRSILATGPCRTCSTFKCQCELFSRGAAEGEGGEADVVRQTDREEGGGGEAGEDLSGSGIGVGVGFFGRGISRSFVSNSHLFFFFVAFIP